MQSAQPSIIPGQNWLGSQARSPVLIHYRHGIVNPKVQDIDLPQSPMLITHIQLFVTGSSEPG